MYKIGINYTNLTQPCLHPSCLLFASPVYAQDTVHREGGDHMLWISRGKVPGMTLNTGLRSQQPNRFTCLGIWCSCTSHDVHEKPSMTTALLNLWYKRYSRGAWLGNVCLDFTNRRSIVHTVEEDELSCPRRKCLSNPNWAIRLTLSIMQGTVTSTRKDDCLYYLTGLTKPGQLCMEEKHPFWLLQVGN